MNQDTKSISSTVKVFIIVAIVVLLLLYFYSNTTPSTNEGFTNDEAIRNIASIYNTGTMTVTNSNVTNALTVQTATIKGALGVSGATNLLGGLTANTAQINALTAPTANITTLGVTGAANINGISNPMGGEQVKVIYLNQTTNPNQWDQTVWNKTMTTYFRKSMPDGLMQKFALVYFYNGGLRATNTGYHVVFMTGIKIGNQVLFYEGAPRHTGTGDLYNGVSNDANWRGTITNP